ncbi:MAG: hypothetical protein GZ091_09875 [Paludibacter sp.]|nr:hypothetical protein [Paludibacter sp.]
MKNEKNTDQEKLMENQQEQSIAKKKPGKLGAFILQHKMVFTLLLGLLIVALWAFIKMSIMENNFEKHTLKMQSDYENKIDSLTAKQLVLTSKVFSWAIRSELTRENKEQVNQFFLSFIQEPGVTNVKLVDTNTSIVLLSTDKNDEGSVFTNPALLTDNPIYQTKDSTLLIICPVMGLNNKIGALVIEYKKQ